MNQQFLKFFLAVTVLILIVAYIFFNVPYENVSSVKSNPRTLNFDQRDSQREKEIEKERESEKKRQLRDRALIFDLSSRLNTAMKTIGQLNCNISKEEVSDNGGWCSRLSGRNSPLHLTDQSLASAISDFLANKTVASFGDGPGAYKELINNLGKVKVYDSYDGAPFAEQTTNNNVQFLDLSVPIYHIKKYDWIMSLEVAEHIPEKFESTYIDNLVRHSREGIILSWAKIGQQGHSHVNNRDFDYVKKVLEAKGYSHDNVATEAIRARTVFHWLKSNINVYRKLKTSDDGDD